MTPHDPFVIHNDSFSGLGRVGAVSDSAAITDAYVSQGISAGSPGGYIGLAVDDKKRFAFFGALWLLLAVVVVRAGQVQLADYASYATQAEGNRSRIVRLPAERGVIYDRGGTPLVRNIPMFSAAIIPADLPKDAAGHARVIGRLASILGIAPEDIETRIGAFDRYRTSELIIADGITHDQATLLAIESAHTPGIELRSASQRQYVQTDTITSLSHVLGYEGRVTQTELDAGRAGTYAPSDTIGKTGLESWYESELRGTPGARRVEVDALGREKTVISETAGAPGKNLVLSLDLDLQSVAEKALSAELRAIGLHRGSVVVSDPRTGEILALVSEPAFDANLFSNGISSADYAKLSGDPNQPLFPRATSALLASGSVFKPVMASAAIDEHIVTPDTTFLSTGGLHVGQWFFPDWKAGGHGLTNLAKALADSVNTYFYIIGGGYGSQPGLGVERIAAYARKFGFGSPTGIDLPGEGAGFVPSAEWKLRTKGVQWYIGDTYHLSIGQGDLLVTPLQINTMTDVVANGGELLKPHVVSAFTSADGTREEVPPTVVTKQVVSPAAIAAVRAGMRQTVTSGSARSLQSLPVPAAAKTGTAQWSSTKPTHAWFTSFAPFDKPVIAVTVMIEEGGEGSSTAAPVAKAILQEYFTRR